MEAGEDRTKKGDERKGLVSNRFQFGIAMYGSCLRRFWDPTTVGCDKLLSFSKLNTSQLGSHYSNLNKHGNWVRDYCSVFSPNYCNHYHRAICSPHVCQVPADILSFSTRSIVSRASKQILFDNYMVVSWSVCLPVRASLRGAAYSAKPKT